MAKSAQGFPVSQGSGASLSLFQLANARLRETVIIGDSDTGGEALHVELPAHDSADRGSPIKIGGKASAAAPTAVGALDRVDAWFAPNGQQRVVTTTEPSVVYDGGRQAVNSNGAVNLVLNANNVAILPAVGGMKNKLLALYVQSTATWATAGYLGLGGGTTVFRFARVSGANQNFYLYPGPVIHYATASGLALVLAYEGSATFNWTAVYYLAP